MHARVAVVWRRSKKPRSPDQHLKRTAITLVAFGGLYVAFCAFWATYDFTHDDCWFAIIPCVAALVATKGVCTGVRILLNMRARGY